MTLLQTLTQSIFALVFGLVVALVTGAFLYPLLTRADHKFNTAVNFLFSDIDRIGLTESVRKAIIGGVVGGVAFAAMGPAFAPVIYDAQVESGIVSEPAPEIVVTQVGDPPAKDLEQAGLPINDTYSRYILNISHSGARAVTDYNLNIRFNGCVDSASIGLTNSDAAVMSSQSESVQVGEFVHQPANKTCYGALRINDFLPSNSALVVFTVDHTPEQASQAIYPKPEKDGTALSQTRILGDITIDCITIEQSYKSKK